MEPEQNILVVTSTASTIAGMGRKKTKQEPAKKKPGRPYKGGRAATYILSTRINPALGEQFDAFIEHTKPHPTQKSALEDALEKYLTEKGFWPPPPPEQRE